MKKLVTRAGCFSRGIDGVLVLMVSMISVLIGFASDTSATENVNSSDLLSQCQGTWIRSEVQKGVSSRIVKVVDGNKETVSYYRDGKVTRVHQVDFEVATVANVNIFTFRNGLVTEGADKGQTFKGPFSYVFKIENDSWYEVMGMLKGQEGDPNVTQYVRKEKETSSGNSVVDERGQEDQSGIALSGPDVDLIKKVIHSWAKGDIDAYRSCFNEDAKYIHNGWAGENGEGLKSIDELVKTHHDFHDRIKREVEIQNEIYEVVTLKDGSKWGHAWVQFECEFKTGEVFNNTFFVAYGITDESKLWYESAIFNTSHMPEESPYAADPAISSDGKAELKAVQGRWYSGNRMKEIEGNVSTLYRYNPEGEVVHSHRTKFRLSREGTTRIYNGLETEVLAGPNKGQRHTGGFAFIYRINESEWSEVWGFLPGNKQAPSSANWTREKKNSVSDIELLDEVVAAFTDGYNQHDAEALSQLYSENADIAAGEKIIQGRSAIKKHWSDRFSKNPESKTRQRVLSRRFLTPSLVVENGRWEDPSLKETDASRNGLWIAVLQKKNGKWLLRHDRGWVLRPEASN